MPSSETHSPFDSWDRHTIHLTKTIDAQSIALANQLLPRREQSLRTPRIQRTNIIAKKIETGLDTLYLSIWADRIGNQAVRVFRQRQRLDDERLLPTARPSLIASIGNRAIEWGQAVQHQLESPYPEAQLELSFRLHEDLMSLIDTSGQQALPLEAQLGIETHILPKAYRERVSAHP